MSDAVIQVERLVRTFDDVQAVRGISFSVERGRVVGFVGANGAGKTTTMRMLVTLDLPTAGRIRVCGFDAVNHPGELRHRVGWMPDGFGAYPDVTVKEYLDFMARAFGYSGADRRARVDEVMEFTDLAKLADREMKALSKGMSQRLCLGRALVNDPEVMVLDEPAAGLDPKARAEFKRLVRLLADDGKTIFISSHILSELAEMCDSLLFIDAGRIVYDGPADGLTQPSALQRLVRVEALEPAEALASWAELAPGVSLADVTRRGVRVKVEGEGDAAVAEVLARLMQEGFHIIRFAPEEVRLEDAFIALLDKVKGGRHDEA
ncbi:MAG: ABC transporter ATP-binding protein [Myxococcales bacterium]|nr:ABC transporter ATP-binding protein [Myxococcales bacterium]MCB9651155.1 ABC transporter ATP-binding protein [Deltaproteobacteria bacterium]